MEHLYPVILGSGAVMPSPGCPAAEMEADLRLQVKALSSIVGAGALRRLPLYARMGLLAAVRALESAGLPHDGAPDAGIVIASEYSCKKTSLDFMDSILSDGPKLASPLAFSHAVNNMAAGLISLNLGITGPCCTVNTGALSLAGAFETAFCQLCSGRTGRVLVGMMDESDERFTALFPERNQPPAAVFFLLGMAEHGPAPEVVWHAGRAASEAPAMPALSAAARLHEASASGTEASVLCGEPWADAWASVSVSMK